MKNFALLLLAFLPSASAFSATWTERSNALAKEYALADGEYFPERASAMGYSELDARALQMEKDANARESEFLRAWSRRVGEELRASKDPNFTLDMKILRDRFQLRLEELRLEEKFGVVSFYPATRFVMESLLSLVNEQQPQARRAAAVARFHKYVRGTADQSPLLSAFRSRTMADELRFQKKQLAPLKAEIEQYLVESPEYLKGVRELLAKSGAPGWEADFALFQEQAADYDSFVKAHLLPSARKEFRLQKEIYSHTLRMRGIEASPETLIHDARAAYKELYKQFRDLAREVAKLEKLKNSEPAAVIRHLKKKQVSEPAAVKALFESASRQLDEIVTREQLVSLPATPLRIRVAGEAESLANPIPHLIEPPLVGNTGQRPEFVVPSFGNANKALVDDFSYEAAALVLTAHEGRPGHDLQFSSMLDNGTSIIRARYAFNNANVEGWGLYAEELVFPFLPPASQLVALQMRLIRVARAFLDPELQLGKIPSREVLRLLRQDLGVSERLAQLELRRFQVDNPGQAPSYFYGLQRVAAARRHSENRLGLRFTEKCFHDGVLALGMMPVGLLSSELDRSLKCGKSQARLPAEGAKAQKE